jgi:hypothetical protein
MEPMQPVEGELVRLLAAENRVLFAYLFGSRARGRAGPASDVDLALWLDEAPEGLADAVLELCTRFSSALGLPVDVVDLNRAPILLRGEILREGRLLLERDRGARVAFASRTLQERIDFEPTRRRCAEGMLRRMREEAAGG